MSNQVDQSQAPATATVVRYTNDPETNDAMDDLAAAVNVIEQEQSATCRLCPFRVYGTLGEMLEQLGQHGEAAHNEPANDGI